jgi:flagellar biosynthetic protein FliR
MVITQIYVGALVLGRISGLIIAMPGLSMRTMPNMVRIIFIVAITVILVPSMPAQSYEPGLILLTVHSIQEFLLGFMMGWLVNLIFAGLSMGTELISTQIGQAAAKQFNPSMSTSQGPLGTLSVLLAITIFLGADIHLKMIWLLADSFKSIPPGEIMNLTAGMGVWIDFSSVLVDISIRISGPIIAFVFLNNFFLAMLSRLAPNMNVFFSVGFLVSLIGGMILFTLLMPALLTVILEYCELALLRVVILVEAVRGD